MRLDTVLRYPDENGARFFEVSRPLTEVFRFDRSAGRVVFWVGPDDDVVRGAEIRDPKMARRRLALDVREPVTDANREPAHGSTGRT